ncbi:hypothetical protein Trihar35433_5906 [Trichoderma harzianum]|nr:hypothetical protein Trihar35433_5906 [Trichoderma harzianum]
MEVTGELDRGTSLPPPVASLDHLMDVESFVASVGDLLSPPDFNTFDFESKSLSPKWLDDVFSITPPSSSDFIPPPNGENKSLSLETKASSAEPQHCQNQQGLCISLATGLLKSMHSNSPSCLLGVGSHDGKPQVSRAVDIVLSANYEALRSMRGLLRCPCYYTSPQLQLLVTIVCAEAIAWYWRIIDTYSHYRSTNMDSGILPTERVEMSRRSFFIGGQCLESHLEAKLISQVVSSRLQELEDLIGDISWNTEQSAAITSEPKNHPMYSAVHLRMDAFLNTQLAAVRRELFNLQYESQSHNEETPDQGYYRPTAR